MIVTELKSHEGYDFGGISYKVIGACIDVQRQIGLHCMEVDYPAGAGNCAFQTRFGMAKGSRNPDRI